MGEAKKKLMECPAVGRRIKPAECGENRISNYECPEDCPHNPWNPDNYDRSLEIYDRFRDKTLSRLKAELIERHGYAPAPPFSEGSDEFDILDWFAKKFYVEKDAEGLTFKQRWERKNYEGMNNDQRILFDAEEKLHPALVEVQQVVDDKSVLAVNLLEQEPRPFLLLDRALAGSACRFSTFFGLVYELPHYTRFHSAGCIMPEVSGMGMRTVFDEVVSHGGGPIGSPEMLDWLGGHVRQVVDSLQAVSRARHEAMLRNLDAAYTKSVYDLVCTPKKFRTVLDKQRDIEPEELMADDADAGFEAEWVFLGGKSPAGNGRIMIGRILLHGDGYVQLESSSAKRTAQLKERFEECFGAMVQFSRERTDDLGGQLLEKRALDHDPALVPERLMEHTSQFDTSVSQIPIPEGLSKDELEDHLEQSFMREFLEHEVPLLDDMTPKQAAADAAMRPKLIELVKSHVRSHDEKCLENGKASNINWLIEELGLEEINFPPPPLRAPLVDEDDYDEDDGRPPMISEQAVVDRSEELEKKFKPAYLLECLEVGFPDVHAHVLELCEELELEDVRPELLALAARVCFQQMEPRCELVERFDEDRLLDHLDISSDYVKEGDIEGLMTSFGQPAITLMVVDRLEEVLPKGKDNPAFGGVFIFMASLGEAIDEMIMEAMADYLRAMAGGQ